MLGGLSGSARLTTLQSEAHTEDALRVETGRDLFRTSLETGLRTASRGNLRCTRSGGDWPSC